MNANKIIRNILLVFILINVNTLINANQGQMDLSSPRAALSSFEYYNSLKDYDLIMECFSSLDRKLAKSSPQYEKSCIKKFKELIFDYHTSRKIYIEEISDLGVEYAIVNVEDVIDNSGDARKYVNRLCVLINEEGEWRIDNIRSSYKVFLSKPGAAINGLQLQASLNKEDYKLEDSWDAQVILTNVSNIPIKLLDRFTIDKDIFCKIINVEDNQDIPCSVGLYFIYSRSPSYRILQPGQSINIKLSSDDKIGSQRLVSFQSEYVKPYFKPGKYIVYFLYSPSLEIERNLPVSHDEWKGRVTSEPIEIELLK